MASGAIYINSGKLLVDGISSFVNNVAEDGGENVMFFSQLSAARYRSFLYFLGASVGVWNI